MASLYLHACCMCVSCSLFASPWTAARQAPLSMGIPQGGILEWVAMPSSRGSPDPGIAPEFPMSPALAGGFYTTSTTWGALCAQSCPTLCDPVDGIPPGSSVHGILQTRILERVAMPFSRGSSQPRHRSQVPRFQVLRCGHLWRPLFCLLHPDPQRFMSYIKHIHPIPRFPIKTSIQSPKSHVNLIKII